MSATRQVSRVVLAIVWLAAVPSPTAAQSASGSIDGIVLDASGGVLPGVAVRAVHQQTGATRAAVTDANGLFRLPLLPVGTYDLTAELTGFTARRHPEIVLTVGQTATLRIELAVAGLAETVTVSGASPVLETSRTSASSTITEVFIDFALLTPGVSRDVRTGDISFAGQRGTLNSLANFGRPLSSAGERIMQLAVKILF